MNAQRKGLLCVLIAMISLACWAQERKVPFQQIEREAQWSARAVMPSHEAAVNHSYEMTAVPSSSAPVAFVAPVSEYKPPRTLTKSFYLLNGLHLGTAMLDVALTQHCLADHHCREGNPMMPSSLGGQLGVDFAFVGYGTFISYRLKKQDNWVWWLSPAIGIAAHTAGTGTGIVNR